MDLDGDEDRDDQARSKAMLETAFQSDAFERVPKRGPNPFIVVAVRQYAQFDAIYTAQMRRQVVGVALRSDPRTAEREVVEVWFTTLRRVCCRPPSTKLGVTVVSFEFAGRAVVGRPQCAKR